jgi:hypothetical protein
MNTNRDTQKTAQKKHRLYVALPLFALSIAASFGGALMDDTSKSAASLTLTVTEPIKRIGGLAMEGTAMLSSTESGVIMGDGEALFGSKLSMKIAYRNFTMHAWNGGFEASMQDGKLTIAALTSPVDIRMQDHVWIVPVGTQLQLDEDVPASDEDLAGWLKDHAITPLPEHYLRERLPKADTIYERAIVEELFIPSVNAIADIGDNLRLNKAKTRAEKESQQGGIAELAEALKTGSAEEIRSLLSNRATQAALQSDLGAIWLPALLIQAQERGMKSLLIPYFVLQPENRLLSRFHPELRSYAWVSENNDERSLEEILSEQLALVSSDHLSDALPGLAMKAWGDQWEEVIADPTGASEFLKRLHTDIQLLDARGYPDRARHYAEVVINSFSARPDIAYTQMELLASIAEFPKSDVIVADPVDLPMESLKAAAEEPLEPMSIAALQYDTKQMLLDAGCMFTSKTSISVHSASRIDVENIVIGSKTGDKLVSFTYDPKLSQVTNIKLDGAIQPYSLSLEKYLEWVRK